MSTKGGASVKKITLPSENGSSKRESLSDPVAGLSPRQTKKIRSEKKGGMFGGLRFDADSRAIF